jgi:hypothetical protein
LLSRSYPYPALWEWNSDETLGKEVLLDTADGGAECDGRGVALVEWDEDEEYDGDGASSISMSDGC